MKERVTYTDFSCAGCWVLRSADDFVHEECFRESKRPVQSVRHCTVTVVNSDRMCVNSRLNTSGSEDEVDSSCNGRGLVRGAGCGKDDSLDLVDLGELASGGSERPDCMAVIMMAVDVSVSTGAASASPCTMTQISDMCAHWPRRAWK